MLIARQDGVPRLVETVIASLIASADVGQLEQAIVAVDATSVPALSWPHPWSLLGGRWESRVPYSREWASWGHRACWGSQGKDQVLEVAVEHGG